jgi:tetratricopeptide (TPR) repeat protein
MAERSPSEVLAKKILILTANPRDKERLRLRQEVKIIQAELDRARSHELFELVTISEASEEDLQQAILDHDPYIVHFSGHGDETGLIFEEEGKSKLVKGEFLAEVFELCAQQVECVILNACFSESQAIAIAQHIDHVIGTRHAVLDRAATSFSKRFYNAVFTGKSIPVAFKWGRTAVKSSDPQESSNLVLIPKGKALELIYTDKELERAPENAELSQKRATLLKDIGLEREAIESYERAHYLKPDDPIILSQQGESLSRLGDNEKAIDVFDAALRLDENDYRIWRKKGLILGKLDRLSESLHSYNKALELSPPIPYSYVILTEKGLILERLKRYKEAIISYKHALKIKPEYRAAKYKQRWAYQKIRAERSSTLSTIG